MLASRSRIVVSRLSGLNRQQRSITTFKLNTGAQIPAIGFGTWQDKDAQEGAVLAALKAGYRHIDGARVYGTEKAVGNAIKSSGIPREDIFLTTKLWNNAHYPEDVGQQLEESLSELQVDYLDLWLMHWPSPFARSDSLFPKHANGKTAVGDTDFCDTWAAMAEQVHKGKVRAVGISNFSQTELEKLLASPQAQVIPAVHQMEMHPYLQQPTFAQFHKDRGIHITQYSPFGNQNPIYTSNTDKAPHKLIEDPILLSIGKKHGVSGAQVALAWGISQGHTVIPKSKTEARIADNLAAAELVLDEEDLEKIRGLDRKLRFNNPSESFGWRFYEGLDGA